MIEPSIDRKTFDLPSPSSGLSKMATNNMYQIFISYSQKDGDIASSLASKLDDAGLRCFMADRSILAAAEWEPQLREALLASDSVLLLMTPRAKDSLWVAAEAGAAWVLQKKLILALMFVEPQQLFEPLRKYQARVAETPEQLGALVRELREIFGAPWDAYPAIGDPRHSVGRSAESFTALRDWEALLKVGEWAIDQTSGVISGEGMYRYLLSHQDYGPGPFELHCRLSFLELRPESGIDAVNAGIVLGWNIPKTARQYLHLMFTGERLLLEQIGFRGGDEYLDFEHLDGGVPFRLEPRRRYDLMVRVFGKTIKVQCDGQDVYFARLRQPVPAGRVGLRPWRSVMRCEQFDVVADEGPLIS
jgi:hypothetical protein